MKTKNSFTPNFQKSLILIVIHQNYKKLNPKILKLIDNKIHYSIFKNKINYKVKLKILKYNQIIQLKKLFLMIKENIIRI